jgi:hypothetical protein
MTIHILAGQFRAALATTGGAMLASGADWRLHLGGAIVVFSAALWSFLAHLATLPKEQHAMNLSDLLGAMAAILNHPETVVPPEVAPQAQAIAQVISTGGATIEAAAASAALPLAEHEVDTVLRHNHAAAFAPMAVAFLDIFAHAWVAKGTPPNAAS